MMLISESELRKAVRRAILKEQYTQTDGSVVSGPQTDSDSGYAAFKKGVENALGPWRSATLFTPSENLYSSLMKHEAAVPYVYDDGGTTSVRYAKKKYGPIIDSYRLAPVIAAWPSGRIQTPVVDMENLRGFATIGIGHLIEDQAEFEKYRKYTLANIVGIDSETGERSGRPLPEMSSMMMSELEMRLLFKRDVDEHTAWKTDITQNITQNMFDALTSIAFNSGYKKGSPVYSIIRLINNRKYKSAAEKIKTIATKSKGQELDALITRRANESELFASLPPPQELRDIG